jgi:hypothetical protein
MPRAARTRRPRTTGLLVAAAGIALFVWLVLRVGPQEIWTGFRQIGWWFLAILALGGLRFGARAGAWALAIEPPHRLRFADAFSAFVCGDTLGNVTPLGPIVGEPTKVACVRGSVPLGVAVTALAIETMLYSASVAVTVAAGMVALLYSAALPAALREFSEVALLVIALFFATAAWALWRRPAILSRWLLATPARRFPQLQARLERLQAAEEEIYTFAHRRRRSLVSILVLEFSFHALGVIEAFITLYLILGDSPGLLVAFILETTNRVITIAFKFVPFQVGFGEAGSAYITMVLGLTSAPGLLLSIVRKARMGVWALIGTGLLVRQGLTTRRILEEAELTRS